MTAVTMMVVESSKAAVLAGRWKKTFRALEGRLRVAYLRFEIGEQPLSDVAGALELICTAAEQAEPDARELLVGLIDLLAEAEQLVPVQALREEATGRGLVALARLLRRPASSSAPPSAMSTELRVPDYGGGRTLTLGERKALARRPTRKALEKLFADPHPVVIRTLLANPKVVEDDVVRLAARRPGNPEVLAEIARSSWSHRVRVRMAIVQNPDAPAELATPLLALLMRSELSLVAKAAQLSPALRAAARDLLARRPPVRMPITNPKLQ